MLVEASKGEQKFHRTGPFSYAIYFKIGQLWNTNSSCPWSKLTFSCFYSFHVAISYFFLLHGTGLLDSLFILYIRIDVSFWDNFNICNSINKWSTSIELFFSLFLFWWSTDMEALGAERRTSVTSACRDIRKRTWYVDPNDSPSFC